MKRQIAVILLTPLTLAAASTGVWGEDSFYRTEQLAQQKALQLRIDDMQRERERQQVLLQRLDDLTARVDALERQLQHAR
jgi:cell division protein FtsB